MPDIAGALERSLSDSFVSEGFTMLMTFGHSDKENEVGKASYYQRVTPFKTLIIAWKGKMKEEEEKEEEE